MLVWDQIESPATKAKIVTLFAVAAIFTGSFGITKAMNRERNRATTASNHIIAAAKELSERKQLKLGDTVKDPDCSGKCLQGTVLRVPTETSCGDLFIGWPNEVPTSIIVTGSKPYKTEPNPAQRAFCPQL